MIGKIKNFFKKKNLGLVGSAEALFGEWGRVNYINNYAYGHYRRLCNQVYNVNPDFQEAVNLIAQECSELPLCFRDKEGVKTKVKVSDEARKFLRNPLINGEGFAEFVRNCFIPWEVVGEIPILKMQDMDFENYRHGRPIDGVVVVPPHHLMKIEYTDGVPSEYHVSEVFFSELNNRRGGKSSKRTFKSEFKDGMQSSQMAVMIRSNPILYGRGVGRASSLINDIHILTGGREWNRNVLENGGKPSGVFFYPPKSIGATEVGARVGSGKKISHPAVEDKLRQDFAGTGNAGKFLLLKGGLQFKEVMYNMRDLDYLSGLKFSRKTIAQLLGIPPELFGSEESSSFNNKKEAREFFVSNVCVFRMNKFLDFFTQRVLAPHFEEFKDVTFCVDKEKLDESVQKKSKLRDSLQKAEFLTTNEKREQLGLEPVTDMNSDNVLVRQTLINLEDVGVEPPSEGFGDDMGEGKPKEDDKKQLDTGL